MQDLNCGVSVNPQKVCRDAINTWCLSTFHVPQCAPDLPLCYLSYVNAVINHSWLLHHSSDFRNRPVQDFCEVFLPPRFTLTFFSQ